MEISGNEDTALSLHTICSVHLITYSQADTTQFTLERFANVFITYIEDGATSKVLQWVCSLESHRFN